MAARKTFSFSDWLLRLLLGHQIGDTPEEAQSPTHNYQKRQNKLVASTGLIPVLFYGTVLYFIARENAALGIAFSFVFLRASIFHTTASASDAIFDSLFERINLQSLWLDHRLNGVETHIRPSDKMPSQSNWEPIDLEEAYYDYPEKWRRSASD
jgi:hypothetical protein